MMITCFLMINVYMAATNTIVTDYIQSAFRILELSIDVPAH